jgi:hypothetical protein
MEEVATRDRKFRGNSLRLSTLAQYSLCNYFDLTVRHFRKQRKRENFVCGFLRLRERVLPVAKIRIGGLQVNRGGVMNSRLDAFSVQCFL